MSDIGGDSVDAAGGMRFGAQARGLAGRAMAKAGAKLGNVNAQSAEFRNLSTAIESVSASLKKLSQTAAMESSKIQREFDKINGSFGGSGGGKSPSGNTASSDMYASQRSTINTGSQPTEAGVTSGRTGTMASAASWLGSAASSDFVSTVAMTPLRFIRDRMQTNRNVALSASNALNMTMLRGNAGAGGISQDDMLSMLGKNPGNVKGTPAEMIALMEYASRTGAAVGFGGQGAQGPRGVGFFQGVQQAQALNPGASVQSIMGTIGGQAGNTRSQQQSMMLTGGAYSMVGAGGRQKSLSQWADSIMKWLKDLRPGDKRGKAFSYGELMAQYYPGSNIDAWFDVNGVSQEMREYWWTYSLGKVSGSVGQEEGGDLYQTSNKATTTAGRVQKNNLAGLRLESTNVLTQGEFNLASKMSGAYGNREQSNRAFNEMIQNFLMQALPGALGGGGPLGGIQFMPDTIEDLLMGLLERSPNAAKTLIGGGAMASMFLPGLFGDVGDIGDMPGAYGPQGGTTTSGMHPDMRRKIKAMQRANPNIRVTSGLRDTNLQQSLKKKGHKNVSGKPSAHTRGMAADLGPRSEYGWIAANASKFGLSSGVSQGEPWHVGMGDIGDFEDFTGMLGSSHTAETMFDIMSSMLGILGRGLHADPNAKGPAFEADLYERLNTRMRSGIGIKTFNFSGSSSGASGQSGQAPSGAAGQLTAEQVAQLAYNQGFRGENLVTAVAIAGRESKFNAKAHNPNASTGDNSYGLWQINMKGNLGPSRRAALGIGANEDLWDGQVNARAMKMLFDSSPTPFYHWGPYKDKAPTYGTNVPEARQAVAAAGLGDMDEFMTPMGGVTTQGKNVVFVNTFNLQGGSGGGAGGGIDVRRTVTQLADHLENEMKQRMARSN